MMAPLYSFDVMAMLSLDSSVYKVNILLTTLSHPKAEWNYFSAQKFSAEVVIEFYYDALVHETKLDVLAARGVFRVYVMLIEPEYFDALATRLRKLVFTQDSISHTFRLLPAKFILFSSLSTLFFFDKVLLAKRVGSDVQSEKYQV